MNVISQIPGQNQSLIPSGNANLVAIDDEKGRVLEPFLDKDYRDTYLDGFVKGLVAIQIRALREQFGLSQVEYAQKLGMTQSVVSRLEDTEYGGITVNTLLKIAKENNVALNIGFTDYMSVLQKDLRAEALKVDDIFESYEKYKTAYSVPAPVETYLTTNTFIFVYIGPQSPAVPRTEEDTTNLGVVSWQNPLPMRLLEQPKVAWSRAFETLSIERSTPT